MVTHHATALPLTSIGTTLGRVLLASVFVFSAVDKSLHFEAAVAEMEALGLPAPIILTVLVILTQACGSMLLLIDGMAWLGAALLALFTLAATAIAHAFWRETGSGFTHQLTTFLEHLGIVGGLLLAGMRGRRRQSAPKEQ